MKKLAVMVLILALITGLCWALTEEERAVFSCGSFEYTLLEDGTAEITGYSGEDEVLTIPDEIDGNAVTKIGERAFVACNSLASITISDNIVSIGERAFAGCDSLTSVTIPDSVTLIEGWAFANCDNLTMVTIPDGVETIGRNPFVDCDRLNSIKVSPDQPYLAVIDGVLFSKMDKRIVCYPRVFASDSYEIPQGIKAVGDDAFWGCSNLTSVTIPNSVTSIGEESFCMCESLSLVTIPDSVTSIGGWAFYHCSSLTSVTIPNSVTSIGNLAFSFCKSLNSVAIPNSVMEIGTNPFSYCEELNAIKISSDHPYLSLKDGVLFSKTDKRIVCFTDTLTADAYEIPQGIEVIGDEAFVGCDNLVSLSIPDGVTSIGNSAFSYCSSLTSLSIPDSVTSIGNRAFDGCEHLTITVSRDSYAKAYCEEHGLEFTYPDANSWLNS
ncbi:MAG: leucine-rich repeat domain-containing protein [Clostridiales bacterium]|nr:leucine-rich repeat domain-containing protein [Clostridiales bacterium]